MGMDIRNMFEHAFGQTQVSAPVQPKPDTSMQNFQSTLPILRADQPQGKGAGTTYSPLSGQPSMGSPNQYSNTVGQWDNSGNQPQNSFGGKGKGH